MLALADGESKAHISTTIPTTRINKNGCIRYSKQEKKHLKAVTPRPFHSTTVEEVTTCLVFPVDGANYSNPLFPSGEGNIDKQSQPVQASAETDAFVSSFIATNISPRQTSTVGTSDPNRNPWQEVSRISNRHFLRSTGSFTSSQQELEKNSNSVIGTTNRSTACHPKPPRYPDYVSLLIRRSSFQTPLWSVSTKPEVDILVESGFFFTGNEDLVRCFQCGIGLKDWVKDDDVLSEHIKHSIDCNYLYEKLGKAEVLRLKTALTGQKSGGDSQQNASYSSVLPYRIRSPRYQAMEARKGSFATFPAHILIDHRTLAVSGLFFTGNGDLCRCFACDGGLKDWSTGDDPIQEHATYFPHCPYINQLKGPEYVSRLQASRRNSNTSPGLYMNGALSQNEMQGAALQRKATVQGNSLVATTQESTTGTMSKESQNSMAPLMDRLSIESEPCTVLASQIFQQLGYSESDVAAAMKDLERKGNTQPTSEDIVNAILDMQERANSHTGTEATNTNSVDLQTIVEENERLLEMVQCMLCVTGEPDILFLPCAHHRICQDCAQSLTKCPVCQQHIKEKVKTFRS